jgi:hypothetical protein
MTKSYNRFLREVVFLNPRKINRIHPLAIIFWIAVLCIIIGILLPFISIIAYLGALVVITYLAYFLVWLFLNLE